MAVIGVSNGSNGRSLLNIPTTTTSNILARRLLSRSNYSNDNHYTNQYYKHDTQSSTTDKANKSTSDQNLFGDQNRENSAKNVRYHPFRRYSRQLSFEEPPNNLNKLFAESSVPGVRDIAGARNVLRKFFWIISFFFFGALALKDISQLVSEYYGYPINVDVRLKDSRRLLFPAITVCNLNIVRYSALCNASIAVINRSMIPQDLANKLCGISATTERHVTLKPIETKPSTTVESPTLVDINNYGSISEKKTESNPSTGKSIELDAEMDVKRTELHRTKRQSNRNNKIVTTSKDELFSTTTTPTHNITDSSANNDNNANSGNIAIDDIELTEREEKELQENLTNWLAVMYNSNEKLAKMLGHQFEDMILRCTIKTTNCTHPNAFDNIFTPTEGNCFTYKSLANKINKYERQETQHLKQETSIAGVNYGLELVLNLEINEYLPGSAQIGAIVMVHHPEEFGNSASEAIFVAPQQSTFIGLRMVNITRLPTPYPEECIDEWPSALKGRLTQNFTYSQQACLKICLQRTIQRRCNCQSAMLPQLEFNSTLKICDTRVRKIRSCVEEVMFRPEDKVNDCQCPPRCQVVNYDKTVSVARWPTREDRVTFDRRKTNINFQNLAKVAVYFQTMTCQEVTQQEAYTTAKLLSSIGGILGMYVGFSFLSVFEIFEVFVRRVWYFCTKKKHRFKAAVHTITATLALNNNYNTRRVHFQN